MGYAATPDRWCRRACPPVCQCGVAAASTKLQLGALFTGAHATIPQTAAGCGAPCPRGPLLSPIIAPHDSAMQLQGVTAESQRGAWKARLYHQGREWFIGRFESAQAAAVAYDTIVRAVNSHPATKRKRALNYPHAAAPISDDPQVTAKLQEILAVLDAAVAAAGSPSSTSTGEAVGGLTAPAAPVHLAQLMQRSSQQQRPFQAAAAWSTGKGKRDRACLAGERPQHRGQPVRRTLSCGVLSHGQGPLLRPLMGASAAAAAGGGAPATHLLAPAAAPRASSEPRQAESALAGRAPLDCWHQQQRLQPEPPPVPADSHEDLANLLDFFLSDDAAGGAGTLEQHQRHASPGPSLAAGSVTTLAGCENNTPDNTPAGGSNNEAVAVLAHATTLVEAATAVSTCLHAVLEGSIQLLSQDLAASVAATQEFLHLQQSTTGGSTGTAAAWRMMQHLQHLLLRSVQAHGLSGAAERAFAGRVFLQLQCGLMELQRMLLEAAALPEEKYVAGVVQLWGACAWQQSGVPLEPVVVQLAQLF